MHLFSHCTSPQVHSSSKEKEPLKPMASKSGISRGLSLFSRRSSSSGIFQSLKRHRDSSGPHNMQMSIVSDSCDSEMRDFTPEEPSFLKTESTEDPVANNGCVIQNVATYKMVRSTIVDLVKEDRRLTKADFDSLYDDLRRTQDFARKVSLPRDTKLIYCNAGNEEADINTAFQELKNGGLIRAEDDDNFVKLLIWRQHLRSQPNFVVPSFSDIRQWIGMVYKDTLREMVQETKRFKNSKPRTRSELFIRLYILGRVSGLDIDFYHSDFRVC